MYTRHAPAAEEEPASVGPSTRSNARRTSATPPGVHCRGRGEEAVCVRCVCMCARDLNKTKKGNEMRCDAMDGRPCGLSFRDACMPTVVVLSCSSSSWPLPPFHHQRQGRRRPLRLRRCQGPLHLVGEEEEPLQRLGALALPLGGSARSRGDGEGRGLPVGFRSFVDWFLVD